MTDEELQLLCSILAYFHRLEYNRITDYEYVVNNRIEIESGIFQYNCPGQTIYLDSNNEPVTRGNQHIIDGDYFYDFNTSKNYAGTYTYMNPADWKRNNAGDP